MTVAKKAANWLYKNGCYLYEHTVWYKKKKKEREKNWTEDISDWCALMCTKFAPYGNFKYKQIKNILNNLEC